MTTLIATVTALDRVRPHRVAVVAEDSVVAYELVTAVEIVAEADRLGGHYEVGVVGPARPLATTIGSRRGVTLTPDHPLEWARRADTLVVPGHERFLHASWAADEPVVAVVREAYGRGARIVSLGVGAFVLAAAGVLDRRSATTHWAHAAQLARRHPTVHVQPEQVFVSAGPVHSAAGGTAVVDLMLHLVEQDHGEALAADTAAAVVAPLRRAGRHRQRLRRDVPHADPLGEALAWAEEHLAENLAVGDLARRAYMSTRSFTRHFRAATGTTPLEWLLHHRVRRAQELLQTTTWSVDRVARAAGFRSETTFRHHFTRITATTPGRYRTTFGLRSDRSGGGSAATPPGSSRFPAAERRAASGP